MDMQKQMIYGELEAAFRREKVERQRAEGSIKTLTDNWAQANDETNRCRQEIRNLCVRLEAKDTIIASFDEQIENLTQTCERLTTIVRDQKNIVRKTRRANERIIRRNADQQKQITQLLEGQTGQLWTQASFNLADVEKTLRRNPSTMPHMAILDDNEPDMPDDVAKFVTGQRVRVHTPCKASTPEYPNEYNLNALWEGTVRNYDTEYMRNEQCVWVEFTVGEAPQQTIVLSVPERCLEDVSKQPAYIEDVPHTWFINAFNRIMQDGAMSHTNYAQEQLESIFAFLDHANAVFGKYLTSLNKPNNEEQTYAGGLNGMRTALVARADKLLTTLLPDAVTERTLVNLYRELTAFDETHWGSYELPQAAMEFRQTMLRRIEVARSGWGKVTTSVTTPTEELSGFADADAGTCEEAIDLTKQEQTLQDLHKQLEAEQKAGRPNETQRTVTEADLTRLQLAVECAERSLSELPAQMHTHGVDTKTQAVLLQRQMDLGKHLQTARKELEEALQIWNARTFWPEQFAAHCKRGYTHAESVAYADERVAEHNAWVSMPKTNNVPTQDTAKDTQTTQKPLEDMTLTETEAALNEERHNILHLNANITILKDELTEAFLKQHTLRKHWWDRVQTFPQTEIPQLLYDGVQNKYVTLQNARNIITAYPQMTLQQILTTPTPQTPNEQLGTQKGHNPNASVCD